MTYCVVFPGPRSRILRISKISLEDKIRARRFGLPGTACTLYRGGNSDGCRDRNVHNDAYGIGINVAAGRRSNMG